MTRAVLWVAAAVLLAGIAFLVLAADRTDRRTDAPAGTTLGLFGLFSNAEWPVTATAREPSTVIRISRSLFLKMLEGYPEAAHRMRDAMAARADQTSREIVNIRAALDSVRGTR